MWNFLPEDIEACLRKRPWLANLEKMENTCLRDIVQAERDRDQWYTADEAQVFFGLHDHPRAGALLRYIRRGLVKAKRQPGAGGLGEYVIRKSAIDRALKRRPLLGQYGYVQAVTDIKVKAMLRYLERFYAGT
jgi:hypothetical protein